MLRDEAPAIASAGFTPDFAAASFIFCFHAFHSSPFFTPSITADVFLLPPLASASLPPSSPDFTPDDGAMLPCRHFSSPPCRHDADVIRCFSPGFNGFVFAAVFDATLMMSLRWRRRLLMPCRHARYSARQQRQTLR
jgi:hypothetical protein